MQKKLIKIALVGQTNAGKSTLVNQMIDRNVSIINRKINTTQDLIMGIINIDETQIIFYDTPGSNFFKNKIISKMKLKSTIWEAIDNVDCILYIIDVLKYSFKNVSLDIKKINEAKKPIIVVFNKIDMISNRIILPYIKELNDLNIIDSFFNVSAKYKKGLEKLSIFLKTRALKNKWLFGNNVVSNKDDIFMTNECTRNALLKYLHQEIPYNLNVRNILFKVLKNKNIKIKQSIELKNLRYKSIIIGKKGETIKKIRKSSQNAITNILESKIHLYLQVDKIND